MKLKMGLALMVPDQPTALGVLEGLMGSLTSLFARKLYPQQLDHLMGPMEQMAQMVVTGPVVSVAMLESSLP